MNTATNPLQRLKACGQSVWLDYIRRGMLEGGELAQLIAQDGVSGVTSNPTIFEQAIARSDDYRAAIRALAVRGASHVEIYETLAIEDIQRAADLLRPIWEASGGRDGFVSLEVSPHLAFDAEATVAEARRLWERVNRRNAMIKIPGTRPGLAAIRESIAAGINVNVTLLFSVERYREVADAFMQGLKERLARGEAVSPVTSVASFFVSRIDTLVDNLLDARREPDRREAAQALRGQAAVANARLAWQAYKQWIAMPRWRALAAHGAQPQRLLWGSTGTKDPAYSDVKYVEALIAPDTVNTMPPQTLAAYRDHGAPAVRVEDDLAETEALPARLAALGIDLAQVCEQLEKEGVDKFVQPYDALLATLAKAQEQALQGARA